MNALPRKSAVVASRSAMSSRTMAALLSEAHERASLILT
jgi:hypothetical protein